MVTESSPRGGQAGGNAGLWAALLTFAVHSSEHSLQDFALEKKLPRRLQPTGSRDRERNYLTRRFVHAQISK
jgi:hypothetical protein